MPSRKCGIITLVIGLLAFAASFIASAVIMKQLSSGIESGIAVRPASEDEKAYKQFINTADENVAPTYWNVRIFNMTNYDDFLDGAPPNMDERGPFVFREFKERFNDKFTEDKDAVNFELRTYYKYVSGDITEPITNIWPTYVAAVQAQAKGVAFFFNLGFAQDIIKGLISLYSTVCDLAKKDPQLCQEAAVAQWGALAGVSGIGIPVGDSIVESPAVMGELLNSPDRQARAFALIFQYLAKHNFYGEYGAYVKKNLNKPSLVLNATQVAYLFNNHKCNITGLVPHQSVPTPCTVELAFNSGLYSPVLTAEQGTALVSYLKDTTAQFARYGVTRTPVEWLFDFEDPLALLQSSGPTNTAYFAQNFSSKAAAEAAQAGRPNNGSISWYTGRDNSKRAKQYFQWDGYQTLPQRAKGDPSSPGGFWCHTAEPVDGHDDTQFSPAKFGSLTYTPRVTKESTLLTFVDDVYRRVKFSFSHETKVKGIDTLRFYIDPELFKTDPNYSQYVHGVVNFTCPTGGLPIMVTEPHWLHANVTGEWGDITGNARNPQVALHETSLDVDPITGATLEGHSRLQVNVDINKVTLKATPVKKLVPGLWVEQATTMTDKQAHDYKNTILMALKVQKGLFWGLLAVGLVLVLVGGVAIVRTESSADHNDGYDTIND